MKWLLLLIILCGCATRAIHRSRPVSLPAMPPAPIRSSTLIAPRSPITNYFVVTAVSGILESLPSNEVATTNRSVVLEWDYPTNSLSKIDGFQLYWGRSSGTYAGSAFVGTNLATSWPPATKMPTRIILSWNAPAATIESSSNLITWQVITNVTGSSLTQPIQPGSYFYRVSSDRQTQLTIEAQ